MAQLGSVLAWGARGRRFKSGRPDKIGEKMKFNKYAMFSALYVLFTSFSTTVAFYHLGFLPFLGISFLFFIIGWYFNYFSMERFHDEVKQAINNFDSKKLFDKPYKAILLPLCFVISLISIIFLFLGNLAYTLVFFADSLNITVDFLMPILCCIFIPIAIFNLINNFKDIYYYVCDFFDQIIKLETRKVLIFLAALPLATYLSSGLVKLSIIGLQMFELTVMNSPLVYPVGFFFQAVLFAFSFIMLTGLFCKLANFIFDKLTSGEGIKVSDFVHFSMCAVGVGISSVSGFSKGGNNSSAYASAAQAVWSAAEVSKKNNCKLTNQDDTLKENQSVTY